MDEFVTSLLSGIGSVGSWRTLAISTVAGVLALASVGFATAQESAPARTSISAVGLINTDGLQIGTIIGSESNGALTLTLTATNLPAGELGVHIHETGSCDPEGESAFASAGGHFNPTGAMHGAGNAVITPLVSDGTPVPENTASPAAEGESHAGDLGNATVAENGQISVTITTSSVTLVPDAETSLADADGSALVIHAHADDLHTDPSGESGDRIACAVLFAPIEGAGATPAATPES